MQNGAVGSGPPAFTPPVTVHSDPPTNAHTSVCFLDYMSASVTTSARDYRGFASRGRRLLVSVQRNGHDREAGCPFSRTRVHSGHPPPPPPAHLCSGRFSESPPLIPPKTRGTQQHSAALTSSTCSPDVLIRCLSHWKCPDGCAQALDPLRHSSTSHSWYRKLHHEHLYQHVVAACV